jgi:hypothetical protein
MRLSTLSVAAGLSAPLILTAPSSGGFVGVSHAVVPNEFGLYVARVYAHFDNPGGDWFQAVAGTPAVPMYIAVAPPGVFYNHPVGTELAPTTGQIAELPSLAFDSFYTIGMLAQPAGQENHTNLVNLPQLAGSSISTTNAAWGLIPPTAAQGNPFDPTHCYPGDGRVLIGQFSSAQGELISGTFLIQFVSDGEVVQAQVAFGSPGAFCPWDCGDANGIVDLADFLALLTQWGVADSPCDIDGSGVGVTDVLEMLANWGLCP